MPQFEQSSPLSSNPVCLIRRQTPLPTRQRAGAFPRWGHRCQSNPRETDTCPAPPPCRTSWRRSQIEPGRGGPIGWGREGCLFGCTPPCLRGSGCYRECVCDGCGVYGVRVCGCMDVWVYGIDVREGVTIHMSSHHQTVPRDASCILNRQTRTSW